MFTCLLYYRSKKELQDNPFAEAKFQNKGEKNYVVRKNLSNMAIFRILRSDTSKSRKSNVFFPVKINLTNKNSFFLIYSQFHWLTKDFPNFPWSDLLCTITITSLHEKPNCHLISWWWIFVETHKFWTIHPKLRENCAFPKIFDTKKLGEISIFHGVPPQFIPFWYHWTKNEVFHQGFLQ